MSANEKNKKEDKGKPRLHTTISKENEKILEKYVNFMDRNGNKLYGNKSKVIEKSLELLDKYHNPESEDLQTIWNRARDELRMVLVGKTTFLAFLSGNYKEAFKENNALEIIEWYKQKLIEEMSIQEILEAIKNIWIAANFFHRIKIHKGNRGNYVMEFHHEFQSKKYGEFWGGYFNVFLTLQKDCYCEYFVRKSSLHLTINPPDVERDKNYSYYYTKKKKE